MGRKDLSNVQRDDFKLQTEIWLLLLLATGAATIRLVVVGKSSQTRHEDFAGHRSDTTLRYTCRHEAILNHIDVQIRATGGSCANTTGRCIWMLDRSVVLCKPRMMSTTSTTLQGHCYRVAADHEGRCWAVQSHAGAEIRQVNRIRIVRTCRIVDKCVAVALRGDTCK